MVNVKFEYSSQADKFLSKHKDIKNKFEKTIYSLYAGEKVDIKKMKGTKKPVYRIRINSYRILFEIVDGKIIIINTILAGNRGEIYKIFKR